MHVAEALGVGGALGFAAYKADKAHNGGKFWGKVKSVFGKEHSTPSFKDESFPSSNNQPHSYEPRNSQNNITEHNTPPSGYSERPSGLLVPDSVSHSPYRNMSILFLQRHRL